MKSKLFFTIILCSAGLCGMTQSYLWAKNLNRSVINKILTDASGNVFIVGDLNLTDDFDPGPGIANLTSQGESDIFMAKYDSNGNYIWAKSMGSDTSDGLNELAIDNAGNLYITGTFIDTIDFDPGTGIANLISIGNPDFFLAKYDNNGNYIWAKNLEDDSSYVWATGISVDDIGNIYVTGLFIDSVDFDPGPGVFVLAAKGSTDSFFAKYDSNGIFQWVKSIGGSFTSSESIEVDNVGNINITGWFTGTADFDPGPDSVFKSNSGTQNIFLAKYDVSGNYLWAITIGDAFNNRSFHVKSDAVGNCYITGTIQYQTDFDPGPGIYTVYNSSQEIFFAKYDYNGNLAWAKSIGGAYNDNVKDLALDISGNVYLTGEFNYADFDPGPGTAIMDSNGNSDDIFFAKYDNNGNYIWAEKLGNTSGDIPRSIYVDGNDNIYLAGQFYYVMDMDLGPDTAYLNSSGSDAFFAKYSGLPHSPVGIIESNNVPLLLYPNPASDFISVSVPSNNTYSVDVISVDGRKVISLTVSSDRINMDVSLLESGYYLMRVAGDKNYYSGFLKQ
ncbi:MAG: SBBP repeat-containing protein [Bacteroidota bacterium]